MLPRSQQAYRLLQIMLSMLVDRGLHRLDGARDNPFDSNDGDSVFQTENPRSRSLSNEGKRTSLGCFYLSSV